MIIKYLDPKEAQKIAAGEVIERPLNIIKELLDNALDAEATEITIALHDGGKQRISIIDNGFGMIAEDARISFKKYTTSKITFCDELNTINTFGFRGEALASICSVAQVKIITRHKNEPYGIEITIQDNIIISESISNNPIGTTIIVENLFYNIPARKKFLKTTATELNQCIALFKAYALNKNNVHYKFLHNDTLIFNCPAINHINDRILQLFDNKLHTQTILLDEQKNEHCLIAGIITSPHYHRYDKNNMYVFVNNRWIKNYQLYTAILKGYNNVLPVSKYPFAVIFITIDPNEIDINIHPKKEEITFNHPRIIESAIKIIINTALNQHIKNLNQNTNVLLNHSAQFKKDIIHTNNIDLHNNFKQDLNQNILKQYEKIPMQINNYENHNIQNYLHEYYDSNNNITINNQEKLSINNIEIMNKKESLPFTIIGQLHKTYILIEIVDGMIMIDQHAAHECILYEQQKNNFEQCDTNILLFPEIIKLSHEEYTIIELYISLLNQHGIIIEPFGINQYIAKTTPIFAKHISILELCKLIYTWHISEEIINQSHQITHKITHKLRAQIACKSAVKSGDVLTELQMQKLITTLLNTENALSCPHGRPTMWKTFTSEIERKFKRI